MLIFGHTGITLGAAVLLAGAVIGHRFPKAVVDEAVGSSPHASPGTSNPSGGASPKMPWLTRLGSYVDIRLLLVGSLVPDIIDKPVGAYILKEAFSNGRIFSHTLLFLILITVAGWYLYQYHRQKWLLILSFGTFAHLVLDRMWETPQTLLWPLFGFAFPLVELTYWLPRLFQSLFTNPDVYIPELVGAAVIVWFIWTLLRGRKVYTFLRYGWVD